MTKVITTMPPTTTTTGTETSSTTDTATSTPTETYTLPPNGTFTLTRSSTATTTVTTVLNGTATVTGTATASTTQTATSSLNQTVTSTRTVTNTTSATVTNITSTVTPTRPVTMTNTSTATGTSTASKTATNTTTATTTLPPTTTTAAPNATCPLDWCSGHGSLVAITSPSLRDCQCKCQSNWGPPMVPLDYVTSSATTTTTILALTPGNTTAVAGRIVAPVPGAAPDMPVALPALCSACPARFAAAPNCVTCATSALRNPAAAASTDCAFRRYVIANWTLEGACDIVGDRSQEVVQLTLADGTSGAVHLNGSAWTELWRTIEEDFVSNVVGAAENMVGLLRGTQPCIDAAVLEAQRNDTASATAGANPYRSTADPPRAWLNHAGITKIYLRVNRSAPPSAVAGPFPFLVQRDVMVEFQINATRPEVAQAAASCVAAAVSLAGRGSPSAAATTFSAKRTAMIIEDFARARWLQLIPPGAPVVPIVSVSIPLSCTVFNLTFRQSTPPAPSAAGSGDGSGGGDVLPPPPFSVVPFTNSEGACVTVYRNITASPVFAYEARDLSTKRGKSMTFADWLASDEVLEALALGCPKNLVLEDEFALMLGAPPDASGGAAPKWWIYAAAAGGAVLLIAALLFVFNKLQPGKLGTAAKRLLAFKDATKYTQRFELMEDDAVELRLISDDRELTFEDI